MAHSESEDGYDVELDRSTDGDDDQDRIEDDLLEPEVPEYPSEGDEVRNNLVIVVDHCSFYPGFSLGKFRGFR
jgi:hypothetical protein